MLSSGEDYKLIPQDRIENCKVRLALLNAAENDKWLQHVLMEKCRNDFCFFVSCFGFQFNPKKDGLDAIGPFIMWQCQIDAALARPETHTHLPYDRGIIWCYEHNRSAVVQKSREMGISYEFLFFQIWLCLFQENVQVLNISCSAAAVDDKSPDSLFWKIRYILSHLPEWMRGKMSNRANAADCEILDQQMFFEFKRTNCFITGVASTALAGVGGRARVVFIDECPLIKEMADVRIRTAGTSDCRFFNGTHQGTDTEFYRLTDRTLSPEIACITVHWSQHPDKNGGMYLYNDDTKQIEFLNNAYEVVKTPTIDYPADYDFNKSGNPAGGPFKGIRSKWYDWKVATDIGTVAGAAMELDIDPRGSSSKLFNEVMISRLKRETAMNPLWEGELFYDYKTGKPIRLEKCAGGPLKMWVHPTGPCSVAPSLFGMGGDISYGRGATNSCLSVIDAVTGLRAAELVSPNIKPEELAPYAAAIGRLFESRDGIPALFGWEMQGPANEFADAFMKLEYRHIYYQRNEAVHTGKTVVSDNPGWNPNGPALGILLNRYQLALVGGACVNRCALALDECLDFKIENGSIIHGNLRSKNDPTGAGVSHADRVMADALAWKMCQILGAGTFPNLTEDKGPSYCSIAGRRERRQSKGKLTRWQDG